MSKAARALVGLLVFFLVVRETLSGFFQTGRVWAGWFLDVAYEVIGFRSDKTWILESPFFSLYVIVLGGVATLLGVWLASRFLDF